MGTKNIGAFATEVNEEYTQELTRRVEVNYILLSEIVNQHILEYTVSLDNLVAYIKSLISSDRDIPTDQLAKLLVELSATLYYTTEGVEKLGIKEDIMNAIESETYNNIYKNTDGTIPDKKSVAELASQQEHLHHTTYLRAYKIIKAKNDAAQELINCIKRMLDTRGRI